MTRRSDAEWEKFGRTDPYYGVLSQDEFRRDNLTDSSLQQFFASGTAHIDFIFKTITSHLDPAFAPRRALDFGCGVGRCIVPLAARCQSVTGLDISDAMLAEATRNIRARKITNVDLLKSDDHLGAAGEQFDLIHAVLVFQHIHPRRGLALFENLVTRLADHGVGAIQLPYVRDVSLPLKTLGALRKHVPLVHNIVNVTMENKSFSEPLMEKNCYPLGRVLAILQRHQCGSVHIELQGRGKLLSAIVFFRKNTAWIPYEPFST